MHRFARCFCYDWVPQREGPAGVEEGAVNLTGKCGRDLQRVPGEGGLYWAQRLETPALGGVHHRLGSYVSTKQGPVELMQGLPKSCVTDLNFAI